MAKMRENKLRWFGHVGERNQNGNENIREGGGEKKTEKEVVKNDTRTVGVLCEDDVGMIRIT